MGGEPLLSRERALRFPLPAAAAITSGMEPRHDPTGFRVAMGLSGLTAGLALWALGEFVLGTLGQPRLELALIALAVAFFVPALLLSGPMTMPRAFLWALLPGVIAPALLVWSSLRFQTPEALSDAPAPFMAFGVLVVLSLPYLVALERRAPFDYVILFNEAWRIVIRAVAAALFVGVFWGVYMMSNLLLSLVGIDLLDQLIDRRGFGYAVTGLVVGLGLSVLYEQRAYLSPMLLMRLLQLLLIPVAAVVLVFVIRVPFRGLDDAFSGLSAATTLMVMTFALAMLISAALDCEFGDPPPSTVVRVSVQVAALLMPVLAVMAAFALWERVEAHGWTPRRIAAALICVAALGYAFSYAAGVLLRGAWDARLRRVNVLMGLGVLALAVLSLTPVINAEGISARDQVARYQSGQSTAEEMPLFEMANRWGVAGRDALEGLRGTAEPDLAEMLATLLEGAADWQPGEEPMAEQRAALARLLPLRPEGASLPDGFFDDLPDRFVSAWLFSCRQGVGRCVAVVSDEVAGYPGAEVHVLLWTQFDALDGHLVLREPRGDLSVRPLVTDTGVDPEAIVRDALEGAFVLRAPSLPALVIGRREFIALPR